MPPTQRPLRLEAAILSRMRSEVTSRSNWANDSSTFRVSRPIEVVVLNCWVTETKETPWRVEQLDQLGEVRQRAGQPVDLVDDDDVDLPGPDVLQQRCRAGRSVLPPEKPPSSYLDRTRVQPAWAWLRI